MSPLGYPALFAIGVVAAVINVIAGGGSFLTLPLLIFLGLPASIANGTNRVGVLAWMFYGGDTNRASTDTSLERAADAVSDAADDVGDSARDAAQNIPASQPPPAPAPQPAPTPPPG